MTITSEKSLRDFEFWSGAKETVKYLTMQELDTIEDILSDLYPEGMNETTINDLFWFDCDTIAEWLGYENFEEIMEREES